MANKKALALTKEQYENLIEAMRKGGKTFRANDRIATALVLEANLGLRIGDILKLRLQDIVLDGGRYRLDITEEIAVIIVNQPFQFHSRYTSI